MRTLLLGTVALTAGLALGTLPAQAAEAPVVTTTLLAPESASSYAGSVNNRGEVLFQTDDGAIFVRDAAGARRRIDPPAGVDTIRPSGLNTRGDIAATTFFPPYKSYLRRGGTWRFVADGSVGALNERGQVLVTQDNADGYQSTLLLWTDGKTQKITAPGVTDVPFLSSFSLNELGQVAFSQRSWTTSEPIGAFLWTAGKYRRLASLAGGPDTQVQVSGLNELGVAVGSSGDAADPNEHVAVIWPRGATKATRLPVPSNGADQSYGAGDVNNLGQIIGTARPSLGGIPEAVLWRGATAQPTVLKPGAYTSAAGLSDTGQVLIDEFRNSPGGVQRWAVAWRGGKLADLGVGLVLGQNLRGQVTVNLNENPRTGPVHAALVGIRW